VKLGGEADPEKHHHHFARFVDEMSQYAKSLRKDLVVSLFVQPHEDALLKTLTNQEYQHIDYLGSDGHIRNKDHKMHRMKVTIFEAYEKFNPILTAAGRKRYFLLEGQRHRDEDLADYLSCVERAFELPMEHLMYYYSAHEMSDKNEPVFNKATWDCVRKVHARRTIK
jgi:hypothetical protein